MTRRLRTDSGTPCHALGASACPLFAHYASFVCALKTISTALAALSVPPPHSSANVHASLPKPSISAIRNSLTSAWPNCALKQLLAPSKAITAMGVGCTGAGEASGGALTSCRSPLLLRRSQSGVAGQGFFYLPHELLRDTTRAEEGHKRL